MRNDIRCFVNIFYFFLMLLEYYYVGNCFYFYEMCFEVFRGKVLCAKFLNSLRRKKSIRIYIYIRVYEGRFIGNLKNFYNVLVEEKKILKFFFELVKRGFFFDLLVVFIYLIIWNKLFLICSFKEVWDFKKLNIIWGFLFNNYFLYK